MVIKMEINDGYMPFKGFKTYYRIVDGGDKTPLICLHGGPGSSQCQRKAVSGNAA